MPVDKFTISQFQSALPTHKANGAKLYVHLGLVNGEHCFLLPVGTLGAAVYIRSSIGENGVSAPSGEDSIRAYIVRWDGRKGVLPLGTKTQRYVTRVPGWEDRLKKVLRILYKLALYTHPCKICGALLSVVKIQRGNNIGRYALCCKTDRCAGEFIVLPESVVGKHSKLKGEKHDESRRSNTPAMAG